ncbi:MAG: NADH-quinone oxidoreductase subunit K [Pseudomonadales bacterium]
MTSSLVFSLGAAVIIAIGVYGFIAHGNLVRRILAFNLIGSGVFLLFGGLTQGLPGANADPVPQAMVITGIVVALAATALALTLTVRLFELTGRPFMPEEEPAGDDHRD